MNEQIQILFKEYDTLRSEITARTSHQFQLVATGAGLGAVLVNWRSAGPELWIALMLFALIVLGLWIALQVSIGRAASRIIEIESAINSLAGANLLEWETKHGLRRIRSN